MPDERHPQPTTPPVQKTIVTKLKKFFGGSNKPQTIAEEIPEQSSNGGSVMMMYLDLNSGNGHNEAYRDPEFTLGFSSAEEAWTVLSSSAVIAVWDEIGKGDVHFYYSCPALVQKYDDTVGLIYRGDDFIAVYIDAPINEPAWQWA